MTNPYAPAEFAVDASGSVPPEDKLPAATVWGCWGLAVFRFLSTSLITVIMLCFLSGIGIQWASTLAILALLLSICVVSHFVEAWFVGRSRFWRLRAYLVGGIATIVLYFIGVVISVSSGMPANFLRGM